ncbi:LOB domain-containing protein 1-like [Cryptomeria japonica]|uniref:LOB domain-containing protein 1-like n=1 Tax=Cryptomeria japonica TaxID=3369 RepID=UPI0025AC7A1D|nr:LOB domain-containing protein 1-like [Cryptomeria japonica]
MQMNRSGSGKPWASPCAACKILRRRCGEKCILAPYFPPNNPHKFSTAHHVFGASNIVKMLKGVPTDRRDDAISSMVYEANARVRDPIYGCAGTICQLQHQISELQSQLAAAQAELLALHMHQANLLSLISLSHTSKEDAQPTESDPQYKENKEYNIDGLFSDEMECLMLWEPR